MLTRRSGYLSIRTDPVLVGRYREVQRGGASASGTTATNVQPAGRTRRNNQVAIWPLPGSVSVSPLRCRSSAVVAGATRSRIFVRRCA